MIVINFANIFTSSKWSGGIKVFRFSYARPRCPCLFNSLGKQRSAASCVFSAPLAGHSHGLSQRNYFPLTADGRHDAPVRFCLRLWHGAVVVPAEGALVAVAQLCHRAAFVLE